MKKKTKKDIINDVSKIEGINKNTSAEIVESFFEFFRKNIYEEIKIHNFGTFKRKRTQKRIGRNPKTGESFMIKPFTKFIFKPSNNIKNRIN